MIENFKPQTSTECYLGAISGNYDGELPKPKTRKQLLLGEIAQKSSKPIDLVGKQYFDENGDKKGEIFGNYENNKAAGVFSSAFGTNCTASGQASLAGGQGSTASGIASMAFGSGNNASGNESMALGGGCKSEGNYSLSFGGGCTSKAVYSLSFGGGCMAESESAFALGRGCTASGEGAVSLGTNSSSTGAHSFAMGNYHTKYGSNYVTTASGDYSFAFGEAVQATGKCSQAFGGWTDGYNGICKLTRASGDYSTAFGQGTTAASPNQFVIGKYNLADESGKFAFIIGNGDGTHDFNIFSIGWDGKIYLSNSETGISLTDLLSRVATLESKVAALENSGLQGGETQ